MAHEWDARMSGLQNFDELVATVADYLNRSDLLSNIPTFIRLAEADFDRRVRHPLMMNQVAAKVVEGYIPLPDDLIEVYALDIPGTSRRELRFIPYAEFQRLSHSIRDGNVTYATIEANQINFLAGPPPDGVTVTLRYYGAIPRLGPNISSNWLLRKWPDAYLYGTLLQSAPYTGDDTNLNQWAQILSGLMDSLRKANDDARFPSSSLTMKARAF